MASRGKHSQAYNQTVCFRVRVYTSTVPSAEDPEIRPEKVILSVIVQVSPASFFMSSDGNYRGPGRFNIPFSDIKLTCLGGKPLIEDLIGDFETAVRNLSWLQDKISTRGFLSKKGLLIENVNGIFIKIHHKLFQVVILRKICDEINTY
jgi:hypothetical protein